MTLWRLLILNGQLPTFSDQDNPLALSHHLLTRWHERGFSCSTVYYIHMSTQKPRLFLFWQIAFLLQNNAHRVLSLLYLPAVNMGLLLAPVSLSYDWQTGSIPAIVNWSDGRNVISILFYLSITALAVIGFIRTNVRQVLNSTRIYICQLLTFKLQKIVIWSMLVMIVPMVPCSNLFYAVGFVVAERLLYMPR